MGKIGPARVLVAGLGEQEDFDALRQAQGGCPPRVVRGAALPAAARHLRGGDHRPHACTGAGGRRGIVSCDSRSPGEAGRAIAEGALLGLYRFDRYRANGNGPDSEFAELTIALRQAQDKHGERDGERAESIRDGVAQGQAMAEATLMVCTSTGATWSMNRPTPFDKLRMTPTAMAETARRVAFDKLRRGTRPRLRGYGQRRNEGKRNGRLHRRGSRLR